MFPEKSKIEEKLSNVEVCLVWKFWKRFKVLTFKACLQKKLVARAEYNKVINDAEQVRNYIIWFYKIWIDETYIGLHENTRVQPDPTERCQEQKQWLKDLHQ